MDDFDYEFDVAFSFNALDEGLATQLNDLLSDRMKIFIYSERQRDIAGKPGKKSSVTFTARQRAWLSCYFDQSRVKHSGHA